MQLSCRAGAAEDVFQTAVRLRLGSKREEYAAGEAVTSHHVTAPEDSHIPKRQRRGAASFSGLSKSYQDSEVELLSFLLPVQGRMVEKPCCNNLS